MYSKRSRANRAKVNLRKSLNRKHYEKRFCRSDPCHFKVCITLAKGKRWPIKLFFKTWEYLKRSCIANRERERALLAFTSSIASMKASTNKHEHALQEVDQYWLMVSCINCLTFALDLSQIEIPWQYTIWFTVELHSFSASESVGHGIPWFTMNLGQLYS